MEVDAAEARDPEHGLPEDLARGDRHEQLGPDGRAEHLDELGRVDLGGAVDGDGVAARHVVGGVRASEGSEAVQAIGDDCPGIPHG